MVNIGIWQRINDTVMGGCSNSQVEQSQHQVQFSGAVSIDNNGGFASIKAPVTLSEHPSHAALTITMRVRGDGLRYQFRLQTCASLLDQPKSYKAYFTTTVNQWQTLHFVAEDFIESYRGQDYPNRPAPDLTEISHIGFLIANQCAQDFQLVVSDIEFNYNRFDGTD